MSLPPDVVAGFTKLDEQVWLVPGAEHGGLNAMLVDDGEVVLFDAGLPDALARRLAPHVDLCVLTHCPFEVAQGARHFREVWAPHAEARALLSLHDHLEVYGVGSRDRALVESTLQRAGWAPRPPDKRYRVGGMVQLDTTRWQMVPAPGHTPGLTLFLEPKRHVLFASDLDGAEDRLYGWPASDLDELAKTFDSMAELDVALLVGSRAEPRKRGIRPLLREKAAELRARDLVVLQRLDHPRTPEDLALTGLFTTVDRLADPMARYVERVMVEKHVARLIERNLVMARQDGRYQRVD
ncbi:MAG TPA: MBL fold metallo-hydrolase [Candidatus Thermoplasmatota archaeon]|nr:MBL fold metallo-hydrolase [Candidatus Thermoplasmatota archaeon]